MKYPIVAPSNCNEQQIIQFVNIMDDNDEIYILIGNIKNTYFFSHVIKNKQEYATVNSSQIYNMLINESIIKNESENVIIFDIDNEKGIIDVISIQHDTKRQKYLFDKFELRDVMNALYSKIVNIKYAIKYSYSNKCYVGMFVPAQCIRRTRCYHSYNIKVDIQDIPPHNSMRINNIHNFVTSKPITKK